MEQEKSIRITEHGPYLVSSDVPLKTAFIEVGPTGASDKWVFGEEKHEPQQAGETYALCRCGKSSTKPFCNGSHLHTAFHAEERAPREAYELGAILYDGETMDLLDNESLCAYVRFCDRGPGVWKAAEESSDEANRRMAIEMCDDCASGRLTVVDREGNSLETPAPQEICLVEDTDAGRRGPLWVRGGIPIIGADGYEYERRNRVTLCRCGHSENKPYCDGSHMECPDMEGFDE